MKGLLLVLLILLYLSQLLFMFGNNVLLICVILMVFAFIFACVNIICAILGTKALKTDTKKQQSLNRTIMAVKLIAIPFFALNYVTWSLMAGLMLLTPGMLLLFVFIPLGIGFTYSILLATSSYSISLLFALYKNNDITRKQFIIHSIFQLIFITDIIDQIVIMKFTKNK